MHQSQVEDFSLVINRIVEDWTMTIDFAFVKAEVSWNGVEPTQQIHGGARAWSATIGRSTCV